MTQILIIGAGPVGLFLAAELARHGVLARVVDKNPGPSVHSKALGVQPRTLEMFADCGVLDEATRRIHAALNASNFQTEVHELYLDLGCFGTSAMFVEEDVRESLRFSTRALAEIFVAEDAQSRIDKRCRNARCASSSSSPLFENVVATRHIKVIPAIVLPSSAAA